MSDISTCSSNTSPLVGYVLLVIGIFLLWVILPGKPSYHRIKARRSSVGNSGTKFQASSKKKLSTHISVTYDEAKDGKTLKAKVEAFIDSAQAAEVESIVIGSWADPASTSPQEALDLIIANPHHLPQLKELMVTDIDSEECEISWILQADYTHLFAAYPQLERLHIKGSNSLVLSSTPLQHLHLKALTIECGGLPKSIIETIATAKLPELEYLQLYIGAEHYGFDGALDDLRPFMQKGLFPKLKYLGLVDSEIANEIAIEIANAPVLAQLETLDLSLGTLSDEGGQALLNSSAIARLKKLDLHYHYLSDDMVEEFKKMSIMVDVSDENGSEEEYRFAAVTE